MQIPRDARACLVCSIVQSAKVFRSDGCPNCDEFLEMRGNQDVVNDCTSEVYEGVVIMTDPEHSWVAKWQRLDGYTMGIYAVKVNGVLPDEYIVAAQNAGVKYLPRDGSVGTDE